MLIFSNRKRYNFFVFSNCFIRYFVIIFDLLQQKVKIALLITLLMLLKDLYFAKFVKIFYYKYE